MIDKKQVKENGINILETRDLPTNEYYSLMERLKELVPSIVNSDGVLDMEALQDVIDISQTTANNKGYELTFAGKGLAKAKADMPTEKELKVEKEQSKNFDTTSNVVIRGDNIEVLKILKQNYTNKIKMIYIDPPYNTKSENFIYNDNFKLNDEQLIKEFALNEDTTNYLTNVYGTRSHSGWLSFMYPRLKLARDLLREDGVIFISIDDNEQTNLKILCDEIFGEENFVGQIAVIGNPRGRDYGGIAQMHDYLLVYSKSFLTEILDIEDKELKFKIFDDISGFQLRELRNRNIKFNKENRPNLYYPFYINTNEMDENELYTISLEKRDNWYELYPKKSQGVYTVWRWGKELAANNLNINIKAKKMKDGGFQIVEKYRKTKSMARSVWTDKDVNTEKGTLLIKSLFNGNKVFDYAKPVEMLKRICEMGSTEDSYVLDFFAGSGTMAHSVMLQNMDDGANRKFILIQWDEKLYSEISAAKYNSLPINTEKAKKLKEKYFKFDTETYRKVDEKSKTAYEFCIDNELVPVISSITIERLHRAGEKILNDKKANADMFSEDTQIDIGFKVFSLTDKPKYDFDTEGALHLNHDRKSPIDTLCNMLCATCKTLDTPVEVINDGCLYKADNEIYITGKVKAEELAEYKDLKINIDALADISLQDYLNLDVLNRENITVVY